MSETPEEVQPSPEKESQPNNEIKRSSLDDEFDVIPEDVEPILEKLPANEKRTVIRAMLAMSVKRSWTGPIPPPDILKGYNECFPGGSEAIYNLAKSQSDHRMNLENIALPQELKQSGRGQNYAFILAMAFLLVSGFLII